MTETESTYECVTMPGYEITLHAPAGDFHPSIRVQFGGSGQIMDFRLVLSRTVAR